MPGREGSDVKMSCLVRGGPPLEFQWLFNGQALNSNERREIHKGEMVLKNLRPSDEGDYTCSIRNDYGSIRHHFRLHVSSKFL